MGQLLVVYCACLWEFKRHESTYIYADCDDNNEVDYDRYKVPGGEYCGRHPAFCLQDLLLGLFCSRSLSMFLLTIIVSSLTRDSSLFLLTAIVISNCTCSRRLLLCATLKAERYHDADIALSGDTTGYRHNNLWCHKWRESWHYNNPRFRWTLFKLIKFSEYLG